jgi:hypothetical protein
LRAQSYRLFLTDTQSEHSDHHSQYTGTRENLIQTKPLPMMMVGMGKMTMGRGQMMMMKGMRTTFH